MRSNVYRLLTDSPAKKKAKKLVETVSLMGFSIKLSRAQELVARLMGYDDWSELVRMTRTLPARGVPDQMLSSRAVEERRCSQIGALVEEFGISEWSAQTLLEALAPTGELTGVDWPMIEKLGLRLSDDDISWFEESMILVREFDAAVRPLYALSNDPENGLLHVRVERLVVGERKFYGRRNTNPEDIVNWVTRGYSDTTPLSGERLIEVSERAEAACRAFSALDGRIRALGAAPMIVPIDWTFLMMFRARCTEDDKNFYSALNSEPSLHIGFDLPGFCFNPENEWNASRALVLQLALRREFFDSGWTGEGDEWRVIFREGNSAKEEVKVRAATAGAAFAWVAAARGAVRLAKKQTVGTVSLVGIDGPAGSVCSERTLVESRNETVIRRGNLVDGAKLRIRGRRKVA